MPHGDDPRDFDVDEPLEGGVDAETARLWHEQAAEDHPDALDRVAEVDSMMAICAGQRALHIVAMRRDALREASQAGRDLTDVVERGIRLELAAALRITEHAAGALIAQADALVNRYPAALDSLLGGRISERHADALIAAIDVVEPVFHEQIVSRAVELAESQPLGTFRRSLRALIESVRHTTLEERHQSALERRRVVVEQGEDGMAWLLLHGPAVEVHAIHDRVTRMAKAHSSRDGETRTLDQLRADVLGDLLIEGEVASHPREARGIRATVFVTVPVLSLLGDGDGDGGGEGQPPAMVEGLGPIPISKARELCGGAAGWTRVLTHPETGMVLSVGRDQYRPPPALARLVKWRADRCMAPGCGVPASRCDVDHSIAWEDGGTTSATNLAPLCRGHHMVKHHGGWRVRHKADGTVVWLSPTGRRYAVAPERRLPVFRPSEEPAPF